MNLTSSVCCSYSPYVYICCCCCRFIWNRMLALSHILCIMLHIVKNKTSIKKTVTGQICSNCTKHQIQLVNFSARCLNFKGPVADIHLFLVSPLFASLSSSHSLSLYLTCFLSFTISGCVNYICLPF